MKCNEAESLEVPCRQGEMKSRAFGKTPCTVTRAHRLRGEIARHAKAAKFRKATTTCFPLFPHHRTKATALPGIQVAKNARRFATPKVTQPATQAAVQLPCQFVDRTATSSPGQFTNAVLEALNRLGSNSTFRCPMVRKAVTQKLPIPWPVRNFVSCRKC